LRREALFEVVGADQRVLSGDFHLEGECERRLGGGVEEPLGQTNSVVPVGQQFLDEVCSRLGEAVGRCDPVDQADTERLACPHWARGQHDLLGPPESHDRRKPRTATEVRDQPQPGLEPCHLCVGCHHPQITRQGEFGGATDAGPVDLGNGRLRHLFKGIHRRHHDRSAAPHAVGIGGQAPELLGVVTGREDRAVASDDHAPNIRVRGSLGERPSQLSISIAGQRITFRNATDDHVAHRADVFDSNVVHGILAFESMGGGPGGEFRERSAEETSERHKGRQREQHRVDRDGLWFAQSAVRPSRADHHGAQAGRGQWGEHCGDAAHPRHHQSDGCQDFGRSGETNHRHREHRDTGLARRQQPVSAHREFRRARGREDRGKDELRWP
jgi:hypothetical protein